MDPSSSAAEQLSLLSMPTPETSLPKDESTAAYLEGLNEAQLRAVIQPRTQAVQVLAGAGTGKTELISRRFVKLVDDMSRDGMARPEERILVVTFTEDAAANMRSRINKRLSQAGLEPLTPRCWISTFHQFAGRLLRAHSLEIGLAPDFGILNPLKQQVLFNRIVQGILAGDYLDISGTLTHYGLDGISPDILSPTALHTACPDGLDDLLETARLRSVLSRIKSSGNSPSEFYQESVSQVRTLSEALKTLPVPHNPDLKSLDNIQLKLDAWRLALRDWAHESWNPIEEAEAAHENPTASKYKDTVKFLASLYLMQRTFEPIHPDFSALDAASTQERNLLQVLAAIYALYQHALLRENACDFDDLINHAITVLASSPRLQALYQAQFEHLIVDEFQDSNGSQLRLLQLLMRDAEPNITVVGDVKQSIYGFRFAQPENMDLIFRKNPDKPPITVPLQTNYRSSPAILHTANVLTRHIVDDPHQQLLPRPEWQGQPGPAVTWVQLGLSDDAGKKESITPQKSREAHWIAVETARLIADEGYQYRDIAVLVKSHRKAENIQEALARFNIPAVRRKNLGFFREPVIKDAMALLRLMDNLHHEASLVRILQGRLNQRQLRVITLLKSNLKETSLFNTLLKLEDSDLQLDLPTHIRNAVLDFAHTLLKNRKMLARPCPPARLFQRLSETVGIILPGTPDLDKIQQRLTLRMFEKLLYLFGQSSPVQPTLGEVIETLSRYEADANLELPVLEEQDRENAVQIITVHGAKGLEYPVTFVAYTELGDTRGSDDAMLIYDPQYQGKAGFGLILGKHQRQATLKKELYRACWQKPRSRGEQQRLFYVALTRAEQRMYVLRSNHSPEWTEGQTYQHDEFVQVLDEQCDPEGFETRYWQVEPPVTLS